MSYSLKLHIALYVVIGLFFPSVAGAVTGYQPDISLSGAFGAVQYLDNANNNAFWFGNVYSAATTTYEYWQGTFPAGSLITTDGPFISSLYTQNPTLGCAYDGSCTPATGDYWFKVSNDAADGYVCLTYTGSWATTTCSGITPPPPTDTRTRIIDFTPADNATTSNPVNFTLHAYINENDIGTVSTIQLTFHNIDQNVILLGALSPSDIVFIDDNVTSAGDYYFSTSTAIGEGNYRIEACIKRTFFGGWLGDLLEVPNFLSSVGDCQSHQFIVGSSTFIGSISQQIWGDTNAFWEGLDATSTEALASSCNPINGNFDIRNCSAYLFVPDASSLKDSMQLARDGILIRWPWGYATRFVNILASSPTSSLPAFTVNLHYGSGSKTFGQLQTASISFDMDDTVRGGAAILDNYTDPVYGKTVRDLAQPLVIFFISAVIVLIIVNDMMGMAQRHEMEKRQKNNTLH